MHFCGSALLERYAGRATPDSLAAIRIVVCALLLMNALWEDLPSAAVVPTDFARPMGVMSLLNRLPAGIAQLPGNALGLFVLQGTTAGLLLMGIVGWRTRITLPLAALAYLLMGGILRQYTHFFHQCLAPFHVLIVLCLLPSGDGLSLDRLIRESRGETMPPRGQATSFYGLCRFLCWIPIALVYFFSGLSKIRNGSWLWWHPVNIRSIIAGDMLNPEQFDFGLGSRLFDAPDLLLALGGLATLAIECVFIAVLFLPLARRVLPPAASLMHLGIWLMEGVLFYDLIVLPLICWDVEPLAGKLRKLWRASTATEPLPPGTESTTWPRRDSGTGQGTIPGFCAGLLGLFLAALLISGVFRIEFYPFSAWQMYSGRNRSGDVEYFRVLRRDASDRVSTASLDASVGVYKAVRYRDILWTAFDETRISSLGAFLDICGERCNRGTAPQERVVAFEIEKWQWNWLKEPESPEHGRMTGRYVHPICSR